MKVVENVAKLDKRAASQSGAHANSGHYIQHVGVNNERADAGRDCRTWNTRHQTLRRDRVQENKNFLFSLYR